MNRSIIFTAFGLGFALLACSSNGDDAQGASQAELSAKAACSAKSCGDPCNICPPGATDCFETAVLKECNAHGRCTAAPAQCTPVDAGPARYEPCSGKACGETCKVCDPADTSCFETADLKLCQVDGSCKSTPPLCAPQPYQPCASKACGATCTVCDPAVPGCFETAVIKECNAIGTCAAAPAACE